MRACASAAQLVAYKDPKRGTVQLAVVPPESVMTDEINLVQNEPLVGAGARAGRARALRRPKPHCLCRRAQAR